MIQESFTPVTTAEPVTTASTAETRPRPPIRVRGRSFMSFVLAPELPIADWLAEVDVLIRRSPAFFVDRPVFVFLSGMSLDKTVLN